jgi:hypothetical protein
MTTSILVSEVGNSGRTWVIDIRLLYFNKLNKILCLKGNIYEGMRRRKVVVISVVEVGIT